MLRNRIHPAFDAPLNRELLVHDAFADRLDPLRLQQEVIVHEIDGPVPVLFEILQFGHHVLPRCARAICLR